MRSLTARVWSSTVGFVVVIAVLLFAPARGVDYPQGWAFLAAFTAGIVVINLDLLRRDPALLERRMSAGASHEPERSQQAIQGFASVLSVALVVVPGLERHHHGSPVPPWLSVVGDALVVLGFLAILRVFRENTFTGATVQVERGQTVTSTGPYARVRHPMYSAALVLFYATPLALGSYWALVPGALLGVVIVVRLLDEERVLRDKLPGYAEYQQRVRYRLIPGLW